MFARRPRSLRSKGRLKICVRTVRLLKVSRLIRHLVRLSLYLHLLFLFYPVARHLLQEAAVRWVQSSVAAFEVRDVRLCVAWTGSPAAVRFQERTL